MPISSTDGFQFAAEEPAFAAKFSENFAEIEGDKVHFVAGGAGTPVLRVPGWPQTWLAWRKIMPALAKQYHVIAVDPPGMGDSAAYCREYSKPNRMTQAWAP